MAGMITLSCLAYPTGIRSTGASWAMGAGRIGSIAGPLLGGLLLAFHLQPRSIFVRRLHPGTVRSAFDGNPGAVAAQTGPQSMIRNSSKSGRDGERNGDRDCSSCLAAPGCDADDGEMATKIAPAIAIDLKSIYRPNLGDKDALDDRAF
jgi:hypothetical protein